jgi:hypothetical protein
MTLLAGLALVAIATPALAEHNRRDGRGLRWVADRYEQRVRTVVEPADYETRTRRVWAEPVYRTEQVRVEIPAEYETRERRVWVPAVTEVRRVPVCEPAVYETRRVAVRECGRTVHREQRVLVRPARTVYVDQTVVVRPGCWKTEVERVCVRPASCRIEERPVLVTPGCWKTITEQVCVRPERRREVCERVLAERGHFELALGNATFALNFSLGR